MKMSVSGAVARVELNIDLQVAGVAEWFTGLSAKEQAAFFDCVSTHSRRWDRPACFQWYSVGEELRQVGADRAIQMLEEWAEYARDVGTERRTDSGKAIKA